MVVECNECHAKFRLDDSKVTERGIKVRCSKCKHVFVVKKEADPDKTVISGAPPKAPPPPPPPPTDSEPSFMPKPEAPPPEQDDSFNFEFKDEEPTPEPEPAPEPPPPPPPPPAPENESTAFDDGLGDFDLRDEPAPEPAPEEGGISEDSGFDDFSFGDEEPLADPPPPAVEGSVEQDDFGDFDFDDDLSADSETTPAPAPAAPEVSLQQESFSDEMPDFSAPAPETSPPQDDSFDAAGDFGADFGADDFDIGGTPETPSAPSATRDMGGGGGVEEFGEISFDNAGGGGGKPAPAGPSPAPPPDLGGGPDLPLDNTIGGSSVDSYGGMAGNAEDDLAFDARSSDLPADIPPPPVVRPAVREPTPAPRSMPQAPRIQRPRAPAKQKKGAGKFVIVLLLLGAIGGGGFYLYQQGKLPGNIDELQKLLGLKKEEIPRDRYEIEVMEGTRGFTKVKRKDGKTLWVVRGSLTNRFTKPRSKILLEATAHDGDKLRTARAMAGPQLTYSDIKTMQVDEIKKELMKTLDDELDPYVLVTDQTMDFVIVFDNITSDNPTLADPPVKVVEFSVLL